MHIILLVIKDVLYNTYIYIYTCFINILFDYG
jgi:hypothetical protein